MAAIIPRPAIRRDVFLQRAGVLKFSKAKLSFFGKVELLKFTMRRVTPILVGLLLALATAAMIVMALYALR